MSNMTVVGNTDFAELCLWAFFLFFAGLVLYLRREDHREGYPMEEDVGGRVDLPGWLDREPKRYLLPHGLGVALMPDGRREAPNAAARRTAPWSGSAIEPTGNPLVDGVGPAAYAERPKRPDMTTEGHAKIVPMRLLPAFRIAREDTDPRGLPMVGCDGRVAGTVVDVWIDQAERIIRYFEIELDGTLQHVLTPMMMIQIDTGRGKRGIVKTDSIRASQFADVPALASMDQITLDEEERVVAYHGGGYLYAKASRMEPLL